MDFIGLAIIVVVFIAVLALLQWYQKTQEVTIPKPVMIVFYAFITIVAIIFLARLAGYRYWQW